MNHLFCLQKRVSNLTGTFAFAIFLVNLVIGPELREQGLKIAILNPAVASPLLLSILFFVTGPIDRFLARLVQVISLAEVALISLLDETSLFQGLGITVFAFLLAYRYGFFRNNLYIKALGIVSVVATGIEISLYVSGSPESGGSIAYILALLFFILFLFLIHGEQVEMLSLRYNNLRTKLREIQNQKRELEYELVGKNNEICRRVAEQYSAEISENQRRQEFRNEFGLTGQEYNSLILAYDTGETNAYIAEKMGIKESTVKQHLNKAFSKINARGRSDMHTMIRDYKPEPTAGINQL